jgi:hypothetical protein
MWIQEESLAMTPECTPASATATHSMLMVLPPPVILTVVLIEGKFDTEVYNASLLGNSQFAN